MGYQGSESSCSCLRLSNCSIALAKESFNEAIFYSEYFWGGLCIPIQTTQPTGPLKPFPFSFLKHLFSEQFCSTQTFPEWPPKAQINPGKVIPFRKRSIRISILIRAHRRCRSFSGQRRGFRLKQPHEMWRRSA